MCVILYGTGCAAAIPKSPPLHNKHLVSLGQDPESGTSADFLGPTCWSCVKGSGQSGRAMPLSCGGPVTWLPCRHHWAQVGSSSAVQSLPELASPEACSHLQDFASFATELCFGCILKIHVNSRAWWKAFWNPWQTLLVLCKGNFYLFVF